MRKSSSDLTFRTNHLFLSIMCGITKRLQNILFAFSTRHGLCAGDIGYKIIPAVYRVDFGDAPE